MKKLDLQSERYSATGNLSSAGFLNQLGRPAMDTLSILVREAVQNSWDARRADMPTVQFSLDGKLLDRAARTLLLNTVFAQAPDNLELREALKNTQDFPVLLISDRGTLGLGGPTRADQAPTQGESTDFVDFLRNIGQPPDKHLGGGTFGYGKAALYLASQVRTICVYTRCLVAGRMEERFMAAALGRQYEVPTGRSAGRYTGRHWWGRETRDLVDPLRNDEARELAAALGMPGFEATDRGTTIMILHPLFGEQTPLEAMNQMVLSLLWNFWPKMLHQTSGQPAMAFSVSWNQQPVPVPVPENFPPLQGFVAAMEHLKSGQPDTPFNTMIEIKSLRPKEDLGLLSLHRFARKERRHLATGEEVPAAPPAALSHHVALMRQAELVVQYLEGPALPTGVMEYAGVFLVHEPVDDIFARAEPPTHDAWNHQNLQNGQEKTFVRVALRRIRDELDAYAAPPPTKPGGDQPSIVTPLGAFADSLGGLLLGQEGPSAKVLPWATPGPLPPAPAPSGPDGQNPSGTGNGTPTDNTMNGSTDDGAGSSEGTATGSSSSNQGTATGSGSGSSQPGAAPRGRVRLQFPAEPTLLTVDDQPALQTTFVLEAARGSVASVVQVQCAAVLDSGELEAEPPAGDTSAEVLYWVGPDDVRRPGTPHYTIPAEESGTWQVIVSVPSDVLLGVNITADEVWP